MRFYDQVTAGWSLAVGKIRPRIKTYRRNYIRSFARFIFLFATCIPNLASASVSCGIGFTPVIAGYSHQTDDYAFVIYSGITIQSTPQAACVAWYALTPWGMGLDISGFKLGMMTSGEGDKIVLQSTGSYGAHWSASSGWTCDIVPPSDPDIRTCLDLNRPCMGQRNILPVLQCSNPPLPQPNCQVSLSGLPAEVEPGKEVKNLRADVTCDGVPTPKSVELTVKADANTGGHNHHDSARPPGTLNPASGNSPVTFSFTAPAPAGDHTVTAKCVDGRCGEDTGKVWVGVKDLTPLSGLSGTYRLVGDKPAHPGNSYLSGQASQVISSIASAYKILVQFDVPPTPVLHLNDASLERGGISDINSTWARPHAEHCRGTVIDVRANDATGAIPAKYYTEFELIARFYSADPMWEVPPASSVLLPPLWEQRHYHVRLLGGEGLACPW